VKNTTGAQKDFEVYTKRKKLSLASRLLALSEIRIISSSSGKVSRAIVENLKIVEKRCTRQVLTNYSKRTCLPWRVREEKRNDKKGKRRREPQTHRDLGNGWRMAPFRSLGGGTWGKKNSWAW